MPGLDDFDEDELSAALDKRKAARSRDMDEFADKLVERLSKALGISADDISDEEGDKKEGDEESKPRPKKGYFG